MKKPKNTIGFLKYFKITHLLTNYLPAFHFLDGLDIKFYTNINYFIFQIDLQNTIFIIIIYDTKIYFKLNFANFSKGFLELILNESHI